MFIFTKKAKEIADTKIAEAIKIFEHDLKIDNLKDSESFKILKKYSYSKNVESLYFLGYCYDLGAGVNEDWEKMMKYYKKASKRNHIIATIKLIFEYDSLYLDSLRNGFFKKNYKRSISSGCEYSVNLNEENFYIENLHDMLAAKPENFEDYTHYVEFNIKKTKDNVHLLGIIDGIFEFIDDKYEASLRQLTLSPKHGLATYYLALLHYDELIKDANEDTAKKLFFKSKNLGCEYAYTYLRKIREEDDFLDDDYGAGWDDGYYAHHSDNDTEEDY